MGLKLKMVNMMVASAVGLGGSVMLASPASAGGLISVNVKVTGMQCPAGGSVHRVNATITQPGTAGSTSGDTVYGLKAFSGNRSEIQGSNFCQTTWYGGGYYWYWDVYRYLYNNGQTTYI